MANLKSKSPLTTAHEMAEVYVVYDNTDYRMTLSTLLSLVTKERLSLDRVNNTSDLEKPISAETQNALNNKADKDAVPTKTAFDALVLQVADYVTLSQLNTAIDGVLAAINSGLTLAEVNTAINTAVQPINTALASIGTTLADHESRLTVLENSGTGGVTSGELTTGLQQLYMTIQSDMTAMSTGISAELTLIRAQQTLLEQAQSALSDTLANHHHTTAEIDGLESFVTTLIENSGGGGTGNLILGPDEW